MANSINLSNSLKGAPHIIRSCSMFILREKNLYFSRERKSLVIIIREVKQFLLSGQSFCILDDPLVDGLRCLNTILNNIHYCHIIRLPNHHIVLPGWGGAWNGHAYSARSSGWSGLPCPCNSWTPSHATFDNYDRSHWNHDHEYHCHNFGLCTFLQKFFCLVMATCFFFVSHFFAFIVCIRSVRDYIGFIYLRYRSE